MTKHHIPHTSEAKGPVDHMIAIGKAGENIQAGHATLLDNSGLNVSQQDLGDGTILYSGPAWSARVRHAIPAVTGTLNIKLPQDKM